MREAWLRKACLACLSLLCCGIATGSAVAQQCGTTAHWPGGTTVQLPTFSFFSVNTTVTVPDRGSAYLGGVNRAASGRNEFGAPLLPFRNLGIGRQVGASSMWVTATIHDFEAMDPYWHGLPMRSTASRLPPLGRSQVAALGRTLQPRDPDYGASWRLTPPAPAAGPPKMSVAQARAERQRQQTARAGEAAEFYKRGQKAEVAGKTGVAKIYYRMAARRATGELKGQVAEKLHAMGRAQTAAKIAQNRP